MTLEKNEAPDWRAAGLDYVGGDRQRRRAPDLTGLFPLGKLEKINATDLPPAVKEAFEKLSLKKGPSPGPLTGEPFGAPPKFDGPTPEVIAELRSDLFDVQKDFQDLRRGYWLNLLRAFAAGVIIAWIAWTIAGGPS